MATRISAQRPVPVRRVDAEPPAQRQTPTTSRTETAQAERAPVNRRTRNNARAQAVNHEAQIRSTVLRGQVRSGAAGPARQGDGRSGVLGALSDAAGALRDVVTPSATAAQRVAALRAVDRGEVQPPPDSRLGAYAATRGYPRGTVGHAVHNAIGTLYATMGTYGEERIGRVFNSREARALYNQPVNGPAGRRMAALEHRYWESVRREDPLSAGGQLGSMFDPNARDFLQRNVFSR